MALIHEAAIRIAITGFAVLISSRPPALNNHSPVSGKVLQHGQKGVPIALAFGQPHAALDIGQVVIHQLLRLRVAP